jgi:hypothetical protein
MEVQTLQALPTYMKTLDWIWPLLGLGFVVYVIYWLAGPEIATARALANAGSFAEANYHMLNSMFYFAVVYLATNAIFNKSNSK